MKGKFSRLLQLIYRCRWRYLIGIVTLLIVDYLNLFIPLYIGQVTDSLSSHTLTGEVLRSTVLKMAGCALGVAVCRFGWRYFIIGSSHRIINDYRKDIFEKMETLSQRYFNRNKTGEIMTYFTNDLNAVEEMIGWSVISVVDSAVLISMCIYRMITYVNLKLTLLTMAPMILVGVYGFYMGSKMDKAFEARQAAFSKLNDEVQESVSAERVIKAFIQEDLEYKQFEKVNEENRRANLNLAMIRAFGWPFMDIIIGSAHIISILVGGYYALINVITLGKFLTFASYINSLIWPMIAIGDCIAVFSQGAASIRRINSVFEEVPEIADDPQPDDVSDLKGEIRFDDVSFAYSQELGDALENISVEIKPGETFAVMGKTGSGKTTFASLITRTYDTTEGNITFDGHDIRKIPLNVLHENIAYVPQDNFLFSETIRENIAFGKPGATDYEIRKAAENADVHDNIMDFPLKYDTMLGERGVTLSGGQKQRTSIARALIKDAPILIMDDSLSAVDTDTESNILANLRNIRAGKTTIMIAHRVSTVQSADHIMVLENGRMAEYGTYDELMALDGIFARMAIKQQLEKQLADASWEVK
ncbi:MAG: ABC transporter ATP-binding protein [Erysipelotrichaceae bacterium]|nr:ABC transporter ATP-binding protein [Erysipelotrichaceae bacterium]